MSTAPEPRIAALESAARYHRERLSLYRAKAYGLRPVSATRMRELERAVDLAESRLHAARRVPD